MATRFYLDKRTNKAGENAVIVSITMYSKRLLTTLGFSIDASKWDERGQRVKQGAKVVRKTHTGKKDANYNEVNNWLNSIEYHFAELEASLITSVDAQNKLDLKNEFNRNFKDKKTTTSKEKTFFDLIDEFVNEQGRVKSWSVATEQIFRALKSHLNNFKSDLTFADLNEATLLDFLKYLENVQLPDGEKGMNNSSVKKQLSFLRWYLRWATKKGYNTNTDFIEFKPKLKTAPKQVVFLEWDELLHVYNFKFTGVDANRLEKVRDVFCFMCFTGLRYSDTENLKRTDITNEAITITTQKTSDTITIELNDYSKEILSKYENEKYPYNKALPVISNQKMNAYLKEMAEVCNLNEPITQVHFRGNQRVETIKPKHELISTHTGRRTFISNALIKGIPANIVMEFTGHSDYKSMEPYIAIAKNARKDAMKVFNK